MTRHRVFTFHGAASLLAAAIVLFALGGCGGSDSAECDGATRGCVQLVNYNGADLTVEVVGRGTTEVPGGNALDPGTSWVTIGSTVGAATTFNPAIGIYTRTATCTARSDTWADTATPPQVVAYAGGGILTSFKCVNW